MGDPNSFEEEDDDDEYCLDMEAENEGGSCEGEVYADSPLLSSS